MTHSSHSQPLVATILLSVSLNLMILRTARRANQSVLKKINTGRTEAEAPILWPPDVKSRLIGKDPDAEKDRNQEEKGATEDEMVGWHHQVNNMSLSKLQEMVKDQETWHAAVCGLQRVRHY